MNAPTQNKMIIICIFSLALALILLLGCIQQGGEVSGAAHPEKNISDDRRNDSIQPSPEHQANETTNAALNESNAEVNTTQEDAVLIQITNFTTDKNTYGSNENMSIMVAVASTKAVDGVQIKVFGVKPYNYAYVNLDRKVNLSEGPNEIFFSAETPYCTAGCGGVYPGPYELHAEVFLNESQAANSTITIRLISGAS
jgi:hypothetical protein